LNIKRLKELKVEFKQALVEAMSDQVRILYEDIILTIEELVTLGGIESGEDESKE